MEIQGPKDLAWEKVHGLMPTVIQDCDSGKVLMVAMMSPESLAKTLETGWVTFYSRTRQALWTKGETSGNRLKLVDIAQDCDADSLLIRARPAGPTCHTGAVSCFDGKNANAEGKPPEHILSTLWKTIESRAGDEEDTAQQPSYTKRLLKQGVERCAQKVGEEGVEVALAAVSRNQEGLIAEASDLLYHLFVLLKARDVTPTDIWAELERRHKKAGGSNQSIS